MRLSIAECETAFDRLDLPEGLRPAHLVVRHRLGTVERDLYAHAALLPFAERPHPLEPPTGEEGAVREDDHREHVGEVPEHLGHLGHEERLAAGHADRAEAQIAALLGQVDEQVGFEPTSRHVGARPREAVLTPRNRPGSRPQLAPPQGSQAFHDRSARGLPAP